MTRLGRLSDDGLRLVDIHQSAPRSLPGQRDQLLAVLHLETADGRILTGVDAKWQPGNTHVRVCFFVGCAGRAFAGLLMRSIIAGRLNDSGGFMSQASRRS